VLQPEAATTRYEVLVVSTKLKFWAVVKLDWRRSRSGVEGTRDMNTRHLPIDRVSLSGIRGELEGPERLNVGGKGERGEEGEEGDSSHGWGRWEGREGDPGQITHTVSSEYI